MLQEFHKNALVKGLLCFLAAGLALAIAQYGAHQILEWRNGTTVLGMRIHNPLDIRPVPLPDRWEGQIAVHSTGDGDFAVFENYAHGLRAGAEILRNYSRLHDIHALVGPGGVAAQDGIVTRWSPEFDHNNTRAYAARVARLTRFGEHQTLNLEDGATVAALIRAMTRVEMGLQDTGPLPYTEADLQRALRLADFPSNSSDESP